MKIDSGRAEKKVSIALAHSCRCNGIVAIESANKSKGGSIPLIYMLNTEFEEFKIILGRFNAAASSTIQLSSTLQEKKSFFSFI